MNRQPLPSLATRLTRSRRRRRFLSLRNACVCGATERVLVRILRGASSETCQASRGRKATGFRDSHTRGLTATARQGLISHGKRQSRLLILLAVLLIAAPQPAPADDAPEPTVHRLIYLGTSGPLFLTMELTIDGQPLSEFRRAFVTRQFERFDTDSDGTLSPAEAATIPSYGRSTSGERTLGDDWKALDTAPQDGVLSFNEVAAHYESFMGPPFSLTRRVQETLLDVDLVGQLDTSRDRSVSAAEFQAGPETLRLLDLDDDETISAAELAPLSDPAGRPVFAVETEDSQQAYPFVLLTADADLTAIAEQIVQQYDRPPANASDGDTSNANTPAAGEPNGLLSMSEIPASFRQLLRFDADRDRELSVAELVTALQQPGKGLAVTVEMPKFGRPRISQPQLTDRSIDFSVKRGAAAMSDTASFFRIQMLRIDADKNRYLDRQEFAGLNLEGATFDLVDRDGNDQVIADEVVSFLEEQASVSQLRVIMRVDLQRQSLFQLLDADSDLRLTRREFQLGPERIAAVDANRNRALDAAEIESRYRVTLELAQPGLIPESQMMMQQGSNSPRLQGSTDGPEWFRRMDLNQDGEVSRREFLGPTADFDRLDNNADGALTATEAQAATAASS